MFIWLFLEGAIDLTFWFYPKDILAYKYYKDIKIVKAHSKINLMNNSFDTYQYV